MRCAPALVFCSCMALLASLLTCSVPSYATYDEYIVPTSDWGPLQWTVYGDPPPAHYEQVDEHDGTGSHDAVYTTSTTMVTDKYWDGVADGNWNGPYDHMQEHVWVRALGSRGADDLQAWYAPGPRQPRQACICTLEINIPACGACGWKEYTSDTYSAASWGEDQATGGRLRLEGTRNPPAGTLRVDEVHLGFWDD